MMYVFVHRYPSGHMTREFDGLEDLEQEMTGKVPLNDGEDVTVEITGTWPEIKAILSLPEMGAIWRSARVTQMTASRIINQVAGRFSLSTSDLIARGRDERTTEARQVAVYVLRQETDCTLAEIGRELGGRAPATISWAYDRAVNRMKVNKKIESIVFELQNVVRRR